METWLFLAAYACSGLAGLVYEVSWTRWLTLAMGHSVAASSTVLAAFMGGLALGAAAGGQVASRLSRRHALRAYVALEVIVAVLAVALPLELRLLSPLFASAYADGDGGLVFILVRLAVCLVLLLLPAIALGATFPVAIRWFAHESHRPSHLAGRLYAANTIGAAVGAVLSGFVLIPAFGVRGASLVGVGGTLTAAAAAITLALRVGTRAEAVPAFATSSSSSPTATKRRGRPRATGSSGATPVRDPTPPPHPWLAAGILAMTGAATFSYEIAWTRVFSLVIGPSTYAFAATIAAFIGGLAAGATAGAALGGRTRRPALALGIVLGGAALAAAWASGAAGSALPRRVMVDFAGAAPGGLLVRHALLVAATIVPVALGIGAAFPLALELAGGGDAPARRLGAVYAVNTLAAVAGSLVTGFVAIPALGLEQTLHAATWILVAGAGLSLRFSGAAASLRLAGALPAIAGGLLLVAGRPWDRELLVSGSYKYASAVPSGLDLETALKAGTLVYYRDGATGTVSVKRLTGSLSLAIDGKVDASTAGDMLTQKLLAHLPLLLHGDPHEVCIIGLGSGATLAAALTHPVDTVDVLEISPEVADASRLFAQGGPPPLDDPRTRLIVGDGRTHLALSSRKYDVIVSEPSNPWMAGVAALFTREFFEAVRARLEADGLICQWVNTYDISTADLESIVATFLSVFPHGTMWLVGEGDLLLVGSTAAVEPRIEAIARAWTLPGVADDLRSVGVYEPFGVLSMYLGGDAALARFGDDAGVQTDDRMALEFSGPRALGTDARRDNVARLRALVDPAQRPGAVARAWRDAGGDELAHRAAMLRQAGAFVPAYEASVEAVQKAPSHADALAVLVESAVATGRQEEAVGFLNGLIMSRADLVGPRVALSRLYAAMGSLDAAVQAAAAAADTGADDPLVLEQLASIFADAGDASRLGPVVEALLRYPERPGSRYYEAAHHFLRGELEPARAAAGRALALDPRYARAQNLLGAIFATRGETAAARQAFETALRLDPRDPTTYQNLALLELNTGNTPAAARLFAEALSLDPASGPAREGLARATSAQVSPDR